MVPVGQPLVVVLYEVFELDGFEGVEQLIGALSRLLGLSLDEVVVEDEELFVEGKELVPVVAVLLQVLVAVDEGEGLLELDEDGDGLFDGDGLEVVVPLRYFLLKLEESVDEVNDADSGDAIPFLRDELFLRSIDTRLRLGSLGL